MTITILLYVLAGIGALHIAIDLAALYFIMKLNRELREDEEDSDRILKGTRPFVGRS